MTISPTLEKQNNTTDKFKDPGKYKVILCNDDITPVDFVISLLVSIFRHTETSAVDLTLTVHNTGSAVAGVYSYEIAEQKKSDSLSLARNQGWPLIIKVEPE